MKAFTNRKWDGICSIIWSGLGLLAYGLGFFFGSNFTILTFFLVFGVWWGVAMVLAISGLRSRFLPAIMPSLATILLFLSFCWMTFSPALLRRGKHPRHAPVYTVRVDLSNFETALDTFRADNGCFPSGTNGLLDLVRKPAGATNWNGPYLQGIAKDPWNNDYRYESPGRHNTNSYDISSAGPPRANAPIGNWETLP